MPSCAGGSVDGQNVWMWALSVILLRCHDTIPLHAAGCPREPGAGIRSTRGDRSSQQLPSATTRAWDGLSARADVKRSQGRAQARYFNRPGRRKAALLLAAHRGGHREQYLISFHGLSQPMELVMPLARSDLQTLRSPLVSRQRRSSATWSRALILGTLLFATLNSPQAQDTGALPAGKPNPPYPGESEITFQWNYVCPLERPCTFNCRGAGGGGGSDHVTRLDIYLGTLPLSADQPRAAAIFYDFSSREFPHSAGFAISTGINSLSCQINGMNLDYSGPPTDTVPTSSIKPNRARPGTSRQ